MRTLEEIVAHAKASMIGAEDFIREAHALGRSEMEAEVEREKADATHAREGFYACQREMDLARAEVERLMALLAETRAQMQSRIDKLLDPVVRVRTMQPVPPIPLTLDASTAALEAEVAKLRAERDEAKKSLDAACEALRMAGQAQHKYRIDRNAAEAEVTRLRAESEERERALREIAERGCMSVINETECIGRGEPTHWMCGACRARAALRPHKEEP